MAWNPIRKIILVDDEKEKLEGLIDLAEQFEIEVTYFQDWERAQAELTDNFDSYDAIILDGKGQLNSDSRKEDVAHIHKAIGWLREQKGRGNHIHYVMYTGYHEDFESIADELTIYDKLAGQEKQMLNQIIEATENPVKIKFPEVFEIFEQRLIPCNETKKNYQEVASKILNSDFTDISGICKSIRRVQESIYKHLVDLEIIPQDLVDGNGMIQFNNAKKFLSASREFKGTTEDIQGQSIENLSNMIYWTAGANIHYKRDDERPYKISKHAVIAMFYALNEQLLWYKQVI